MPMSYDLEINDHVGYGVEHQLYRHMHQDSHYSYGRWTDRCADHFVRNGCCTCTPHCPEGMIIDKWAVSSESKNDHVCVILPTEDAF